MIRIENLTKRFGRTIAVDRFALDVGPGESVALWGANGAGKSTILRCAIGLLSYSGRISIGGHDVRRHGKRARRLIGYVPQELGFNDDLRLAEAVRLFARLRGVSGAEAASVLARVGLDGHGRKRMRDLSGGMKQRLALSLALLGDPPVLILDEVTASLDAWGRSEFMGLLRGLAGAGRSILFASHRVDEVAALAARVVILDRGRTAEEVPAVDFACRKSEGSEPSFPRPVAASSGDAPSPRAEPVVSRISLGLPSSASILGRPSAPEVAL